MFVIISLILILLFGDEVSLFSGSVVGVPS